MGRAAGLSNMQAACGCLRPMHTRENLPRIASVVLYMYEKRCVRLLCSKQIKLM